ncbi:hypothetical protein [Cutibacterium namnetense]|uniref:Transmembrane protein n=1 Tax=Cutibacterium namnetense TaxID=1574624 RepID=A0ABX9IAD5_9ACTN|nr:hypothetical protein CP880_07715 [Cutibacterium namnetense]
MSVEPRYLSADMDNPPMAPSAEGIYGIARMERVMSRNPHQPRAFSLAHIMIPAWLPLGALVTWAGVSMLLDNTDGFREGYAGWIIILGSLAAPYTGLTQGLWLRPGVDHDKVWTRFGHLFYRQIRFNDITRLDIGLEHYKIRAGKTKINIGYDRFDYALFYLRLLEELHHRHIHLPEANITDPNWDEEAQIWRNILAEEAWVDHRDFYDTHPEQLARLNALIPPPDHYDD